MLHNDPFHGGFQLQYHKKGGGGSTTEYVQSPEAQEIMRLLMPTMERIGMAGQYGGVVPEGMEYGVGRFDEGTIGGPAAGPATPSFEGPLGVGRPTGSPSAEQLMLEAGIEPGTWGLGQYPARTTGDIAATAYQQPGMGQTFQGVTGDLMGQKGGGGPMMPGLLWGPGSYGIPGYGMPSPYDVPDIAGMMPSEATMGAISQDVRQAVMAPYKETEQQLLETLGAAGGLGSARGGFSGQGAAGVGRYWGDVAPEYTRSLWGMVAPAQQAGWGAELGRGRDVYGAELGREASLFGAGLGRAKDIWGQEQMAKQFPYSVIPGMAGASMPSPVVSQGGGKK